MLKVVLFDPIPEKNFRISKDTSGAYGTGNDFGDTIIPNILKRALKYSHDWPPLHSAYTLAVLKNKNYNSNYTKDLNYDFSNVDVVIIISSIVCCETEIECIKKIKKINDKIKIFVIGPFATNNPEKYIDEKAIVISGEPEFFFLKYDNLLKFEDGQIIKFDHENSLDDLPFPAWDKMLDSKYKVSLLFGNYKTVPIIATRGCPYSCFKYCVYPLQQGRKVRQRDPKKIVDELEYWKKKFNIKMFIFRDPVFSINRKHTIELCNEIINRNLKINYIIETHLRILDDELIFLLKKSGLKGVKVGVESSNLEVLKDADRYTVPKDDQKEKINFLESQNIKVSAMYIIGFPQDNFKTVNHTIDYSISLNTTYAQFAVWTPYPGTPIFKEYKEKIFAKKFEEFSQYQLVFNHKNLSAKDIRHLLSKAYTKYYFRFKWILKLAKAAIS